MLTAQQHARQVRDRLWRPANGRVSSELDVVSEAELRRQHRRNAIATAMVEALRQREEAERIERDRLEQQRQQLFAGLVDAHKRSGFTWKSKGDERPPLSFDEITHAVCEFYDMPRRLVFSQRRAVNLVRPRQIIMYLCREFTALSFPQIARLMDGRDHTTIMSGARRIARLIPNTPKLSSDIETIKKTLRVAT